MADKVVGRVFQDGTLKVLGELDETISSNNAMTYKANGNLLVGGEFIEEIRESANQTPTGTEVNYVETLKADFDKGTLTNVAGKSDDTLQLAGESSTGYPHTIVGAYNTGAYGMGFTVNEPVILDGWKSQFNIPSTTSKGKTTYTPETINFAIYANYTWGENLTVAGRTPMFTTSHTFNTSGEIYQFTGLNWVLPKGTYWLGVTNTTFTGGMRDNSGAWGVHPVTSAGGAVTSIKACRSDGYTVGQDNWYYCWEWILKPCISGNRISPPIDLSSITKATTHTISWNATIPSGSTLKIETSMDGGVTWNQPMNYGSIAGIAQGDDLRGKSLLIRETFTLGTATTSPSLQDLTIRIGQDNSTSSGSTGEEVLTIQIDGTNLKVTNFEEGVIL